MYSWRYREGGEKLGCKGLSSALEGRTDCVGGGEKRQDLTEMGRVWDGWEIPLLDCSMRC